MKAIRRFLFLNFLLIITVIFFAYIREIPKIENEQSEPVIEKVVESVIEKPINSPVKSTLAPTSTQKSTATPVPKPIDPNAGKCIITIDSQKYDVTVFRNMHSGGDIFNCGTNMTKIFYNQHSASTLKKMSKYKIA